MRAILAKLILALALVVVSACGEQGREFTAAELVAELNREGAPIHLKGALLSGREGFKAYELELVEPMDPASPEAHTQEGHSHGAGGATLVLTEDEEDAPAEFERCESSVTLTCFRIANGVLLLAGDDPLILEKVENAVRAMASE